eukprot:14390370-Alexandrium_andersonii.AAC.2
MSFLQLVLLFLRWYGQAACHPPNGWVALYVRVKGPHFPASKICRNFAASAPGPRPSQLGRRGGKAESEPGALAAASNPCGPVASGSIRLGTG